MKLTRFRVQNYKVIDDTGWVPVDGQVTALVGKNEAGKSGIMRALWKSKNVAGKKFDKLLDYPRDRYARERKETQEVTALAFSLSPEETTALKALLPEQAQIDPKEVILTTFYKGEEETDFSIRFDEEIERLCPSADGAQGAADSLAGARKWATDNLPVFIYFDNYGQLKTRINLPLFQSRRAAPDEETRAQAALFEWSHLDPPEIQQLGQPKQGTESDDVVQRRKEKRRALLDSASFGLTGDWIEWWSEKRHKLHFDADGDDLVLKVSDDHNEFPLPFEERSHGFQWFFSFYLVFLVESKKTHKGAILLLDEPGLSLHPTLQAKLIRLFDRISAGNQIIYSTHLPFLVDGDHLERVRTVHLAGPEPQKTVVSNDIRPSGDKDTLFPIQAAVGYSIAQTLFLGKRSVIVEGVTDYWILKALDACLAASGNVARLHADTVLIPAGGTSRLMPLASIMLGTAGLDGRQMLVLLDSDPEGQQAAVRAQKDLFGGNDSRILMLGPAVSLEKATIEDLVPRDVYLKALADGGFKVTLTAEEQQAATTVGAIEKAFQRLGLGKFGAEHKAAATLKLIDQWGKDPKSVPAATLTKSSALFAAVNARFEPTRADGAT